MRNFVLKLSLLAICVFALPVAAEARGLVVSPKRVVFEKGQRLVEVILANRGDEKEVYRISLVNRKMLENGQLVNRLFMNLSSSFDHRFVDGFDAASMIQAVKEVLEQPALLFMPD